MAGEQGALAAFWGQACAGLALDPASPYRVCAFGDSPALAEQLLALVLAGRKRASARLAWGCAQQALAVPACGALSIVCDGAGRPGALIRTTQLRQLPFEAVDAGFAWREGEGDRSLSHWRTEHWQSFSRECTRHGRSMSVREALLCEDFELIWPRPGGREDLRCFAPVLGATPRVLVLGSMPGSASLKAQHYYAHPRNAFWPVMEALFGIPLAAPYPTRLAGLCAQGVALWDVLASCRRAGSLDSAIEADSVWPNDLTALLAAQASIGAIFLNGGSAATWFRRHLKPALSPPHSAIPCYTLPSTSPAHARLSLAQKIEAWRVMQHSLAALR